MNIFITGISGFVGSHMADFLLKEVPDCNIYAIKRWRSKTDNIKHLFDNSKVKFIEADLIDRGSIHNALRIAKPDLVYHFASQSHPQVSFATPIQTAMTNCIGTVNLLDEIYFLKKENYINPIIVSISTSEVYGQPKEDEVPIKETNPIRAANPYSISKIYHDFMSQYYYKAYGLKVITTRMFSHEGKRRGKTFALSSFAYQIVQHEKANSQVATINVGNLNSLRTYSHINDAINAYWLCYTKGKVGEVYNIGGTDTLTVGEALEKLISKSTISKDKFNIVVDKERIRPTDITLQIPDTQKFRNDTGWESKKTIDDICDDLLTYWREEL